MLRPSGSREVKRSGTRYGLHPSIYLSIDLYIYRLIYLSHNSPRVLSSIVLVFFLVLFLLVPYDLGVWVGLKLGLPFGYFILLIAAGQIGEKTAGPSAHSGSGVLAPSLILFIISIFVFLKGFAATPGSMNFVGLIVIAAFIVLPIIIPVTDWDKCGWRQRLAFALLCVQLFSHLIIMPSVCYADLLLVSQSVYWWYLIPYAVVCPLNFGYPRFSSLVVSNAAALVEFMEYDFSQHVIIVFGWIVMLIVLFFPLLLFTMARGKNDSVIDVGIKVVSSPINFILMNIRMLAGLELKHVPGTWFLWLAIITASRWGTILTFGVGVFCVIVVQHMNLYNRPPSTFSAECSTDSPLVQGLVSLHGCTPLTMHAQEYCLPVHLLEMISRVVVVGRPAAHPVRTGFFLISERVLLGVAHGLDYKVRKEAEVSLKDGCFPDDGFFDLKDNPYRMFLSKDENTIEVGDSEEPYV